MIEVILDTETTGRFRTSLFQNEHADRCDEEEAKERRRRRRRAASDEDDFLRA